MGIRPDRKILIIGFVLVSMIFLALRLKTLDHLLMYDEARNIISLRAFLCNNTADPFYENYFFHPPMYMSFASLLEPFKAGFALRLEWLSLAFSYLTLFVVYLLSARLGGAKYAFLSGLFLSVMPVSIAYDTWIKRDPFAIALGYLAIFLLIKRRYWWCAVALSFSLLAKENAVFFILSVTAILFVLKEPKIPKKIAMMYGIIFIMTSWWYIFFSSMPRSIFDVYLSAEKNIAAWANSPLYYCGKLLPDMGSAMLVLFILGCGYIIYLTCSAKKIRWSVPLVTVLCVYVPISVVIACKTPWLSVSAAPALAMVAGSGAMLLLRLSKKYKAASVILTALLAILLLGGSIFSYDKYHMDTYPKGWSGASYSRDLALYLNKAMKRGERLMLTQFSYWGRPVCLMCPVFLYYSEARPIFVVDGNDDAGEVVKEIIANKTSWLVVFDPQDAQINFHSLAISLEDVLPERSASVGCSRIWKTDSLWRRQT